MHQRRAALWRTFLPRRHSDFIGSRHGSPRREDVRTTRGTISGSLSGWHKVPERTNTAIGHVCAPPKLLGFAGERDVPEPNTS